MYGGDRLLNLSIFEAGLALSLIQFFAFGRPNYDKAKPTGPYSVGFKEFTTDEHWNDCSVFYPVDQDIAEKYAKEGKGLIHPLRYPKSLNALAHALTWLGGCPKGFQKMRVKFMTFVWIPVADGAPLAGDFAHGKK